MDIDAFQNFVDMCKITDRTSARCKPSALDRLFSKVNKYSPHHDDMLRLDGKSALRRYEFLEAVLQLSIAKYIDDEMDNMDSGDIRPEDALRHLLKLIEVRLSSGYSGKTDEEPMTIGNSNNFRRDVLYQEGVYMALEPSIDSLRRIFYIYASPLLEKNHNGSSSRPEKRDTHAERGQSKNEERAAENEEDSMIGCGDADIHRAYMSCAQWVHFLNDCIVIFDKNVTVQVARKIFTWSLMLRPDDRKNKKRVYAMEFEDFIEGLCRICERKRWPSEKDLKDVGVNDIFGFVDTIKGNGGSLFDWFSEETIPWYQSPKLDLAFTLPQMLLLVLENFEAVLRAEEENSMQDAQAISGENDDQAK